MFYFRELYRFIEPSTKKKTWIIHPFRSRLNSVEVELGYAGPIKCAFGAIKQGIDYKTGDRLLIFKGSYRAKVKMQQLTLPNAMELIGMEKGVILSDCMLHIVGDCHVKVQNLTVTALDGMFSVEANSTLSISNCTLKYGQTGIIARDRAKLIVLGCKFSGGCIGIKVLPTAQIVNISQCLFTKNGQVRGREQPPNSPSETYGCIQVFDEEDTVDDETQLVKLTCTDNVFEDNLCYPVVERIHRWILDANTYVLKKNILKGYNGIYTKRTDVLRDANVLYHSE